jgi:hypothetical protein
VFRTAPTMRSIAHHRRRTRLRRAAQAPPERLACVSASASSGGASLPYGALTANALPSGLRTNPPSAPDACHRQDFVGRHRRRRRFGHDAYEFPSQRSEQRRAAMATSTRPSRRRADATRCCSCAGPAS